MVYRFNMGVGINGNHCQPAAEVSSTGEFVRYSDYATLTAENEALRARLETVEADRAAQAERIRELEDSLREAEYNVKSRLRLAFRKALAELPEIAPAEIRSVLSSVHMQDEFLAEGKRLQRVHGLDAVAPRVEQECGAGAWSFMRQGVRAALGGNADA